MIPARRLYVLATGFTVGALACALVAFLRRNHFEDAWASLVRGAYFDRSQGAPAFAGEFSDLVFSPFRPLHAYLWLGLAAGFAVAAIATALLARAATRQSQQPAQPLR